MDLTTKFLIIWERTVKVGIATDPALRTALVLKLIENGNLYRLHDPSYVLMISAEFLAVANYFHDEATSEMTARDRYSEEER